MTDNHKCAHPACNCTVTEHHKYCSEYCHDARDTVELSCNCGRGGCAEELTHRGTTSESPQGKLVIRSERCLPEIFAQ